MPDAQPGSTRLVPREVLERAGADSPAAGARWGWWPTTWSPPVEGLLGAEGNTYEPHHAPEDRRGRVPGHRTPLADRAALAAPVPAAAFFGRGTSGQWRDRLDDADRTRYAARVRILASHNLVDWIHSEAIE